MMPRGLKFAEATAWIAAAVVVLCGVLVYPLMRASSPSIEFLGPPVETVVKLGADATPVHYGDVIRREVCSATVFPRWRAVGPDGGPGELDGRWTPPPYPVTPADPTDTPRDFVALVPVPPPGAPGRWFYAPILRPGPDCAQTEEILPPPHPVRVEP